MILTQTELIRELVMTMRAQQKEVILSDVTDIIINCVAEALKVDVNHMKTSSRQAPLPEARFICFYLLREYTKLTLKEIALIFGDRNHTTIVNGIKVYRQYVESKDKSFQAKIDKVADKLEYYIDNNWFTT